ncbi:YgaP family membrane protein [Spirochaeta africana]|uniref:Inner membrane protein YgaP-like transmembrane domain-containing protein n=1 Tax=Spirochaeta africana (strain ATCC 700263 / DSM 8902 / Z-7692) TaxID=889378 RepID=H9ULH3_SPIAZ|nr:DUF2892 domain-containing protein [Spirochaeta africana]AFG38366.1 Protein of unknown function (DUF2892) [Spirochaeta africana DSM 8902]
MNKNVGNKDKAVRVILGILFVAAGFGFGGAWLALAVVGAVLLITAATGFCGLYTLLGINTCKLSSDDK